MADVAVAAREVSTATSRRRSAPTSVAGPAPSAVGIPSGVGALVADSAAGERLHPDVARPLTKTFGLDLSSVRVHVGTVAAGAAQRLGARAFTVANHVFLRRGEKATDLSLLAHEVAHVVQQRGTAVVQRATDRAGMDRFEREARRASTEATQGAAITVREQTSVGAQGFGFGDALDYIADKANLLPGFRLLTVVLGRNPINWSEVPRTTANLLRGVIEILPGASLVTTALEGYGIFEKIGAWVDGQIGKLGLSAATIKKSVVDFLDSLGWRDILHPGEVFDRAKKLVTDPVDRLVTFGRNLLVGIIGFVKEAILKPLGDLASKTRGWDLLKAVLGKDPITGEEVTQTADNLIGGFMKLIDQVEVWENLKKAHAIPRAFAWFKGALVGVLGFVRQLPGLFVAALKSLQLEDIVLPWQAFAKIGKVFGKFAGDFFSWAGTTIFDLLKIIFEVLAPSVMPYLVKAMGAFRTIVRNPVGFIKNLVRAGIQGFTQFVSNFLAHLKAALIGWLTGTLGDLNIYIPKAFDMREIVKFVLSVLGLTYDNIRGKLVKEIGETAVSAIEKGVDIVVTLVKEGPAAAWEKIKEQLSNLRELVMDKIMSFIKTEVIEAAITKILSSLNPVGAFVQAVIAIYNTIMFFVERLKQIAKVVAAVIDSISEIAAGAIGSAANKVEQTMAGLLTLVISFLARIAGLGKVSDMVVDVVNKIRAPIDKALDSVVKWIVGLAKAFVGKAVGAVTAWWKASKSFKTATGEQHTLLMKGAENSAQVMIQSNERTYGDFLKEAKVGNSQEGRKAMRSAGATWKEMSKLADSKADSGKKAERMLELLDALVADTVVILQADPNSVKPVPLVYGSLTSGEFGSSVLALVITPTTVKVGSAATAKGGSVWPLLALRGTPGNYTFYRRGHLLSEALGGSGADWRNLAPQSTRGNSNWYFQMEKAVIKLVGSGSAWLRVQAVYAGTHKNVSQFFAKWGPDAEESHSAELNLATVEDKYVPSGYQAKWGPGPFGSGGGGQGGDLGVQNDISIGDGKYFLTKAERELLEKKGPYPKGKKKTP